MIAQHSPEVAPVEMAVKALFDAIHRDDIDAVRQLFSKDGNVYLPTGAELDPTRSGATRIFRLAEEMLLICSACSDDHIGCRIRCCLAPLSRGFAAWRFGNSRHHHAPRACGLEGDELAGRRVVRSEKLGLHAYFNLVSQPENG